MIAHAVPLARQIVRNYVALQAQNSRLLEVAMNESGTVNYLGRTVLAQYLITGGIDRSMVERWVMEAVANESQL